MTELEKMQVALFTVIRNSKVLPVGIAKEKSMQEINKMSYETMQECIKMINFDIAVKYYQEGKQLCEAMESVQKWSNKHPQKTYLTDFLDKHPNAPLDNGYPRFICPYYLGYMTEHQSEDCPQNQQDCEWCWNTPLESEEK